MLLLLAGKVLQLFRSGIASWLFRQAAECPLHVQVLGPGPLLCLVETSRKATAVSREPAHVLLAGSVVTRQIVWTIRLKGKRKGGGFVNSLCAVITSKRF